MSEMDNRLVNSLGSDEMSIEQKIFQRAWDDDDFKDLLLKDPRAAFTEYFPEMKLPPDNKRIVFHENKLDEMHVVIPVNPALTGDGTSY